MALKPPIKSLQPTAEYTRLKPLYEGPATVEDLSELIEAADSNPPATPGSLFLSREQMHEISHLLGLNILSPDQLVSRVKTMSTITVAGAEITLSPAILHRLKTRAGRISVDEYLKIEVPRLLKGAVGL